MKSFATVIGFLVFNFAVGFPNSKEQLGFTPYLRRLSPENNTQEFIIGGEDAEEGKYPYMLSLRYMTERLHFCGASVLTANHALTAAHCCAALQSRSAYVMAGSNKLSTGGDEHLIESFKMHPKYDPLRFWLFDVCVIKVKNPFKFGEKVGQVTVPPKNWPVPSGTKLTLTGWGYTRSGDPTATTDKLQVGKNYTALSHDECYQKTKFSHVSYLCAFAGGPGKGACNGDSGSPITKDGVQVGVASWVLLPCGKGMPDFYSRVPTTIDWVESVMGDDAKNLKRLEE